MCCIDPGSPWQNGYLESFNSRLRDELLSVEIFDAVLEAPKLIEDWRNDLQLEQAALRSWQPAASEIRGHPEYSPHQCSRHSSWSALQTITMYLP
ncbi:MAG: transposase [Actinobacteria bacterium]|nr:transposase [Actinomycetota bacterium]